MLFGARVLGLRVQAIKHAEPAGPYAPESCGDYASGTNHCQRLSFGTTRGFPSDLR